MNDFKIINRYGKEYPNIYEDGQMEFYLTHVKIMEQRHSIVLPKIKKVFIGDSSYPVTEIHFEDGLILYDEEFSPPWAIKENKKTLKRWLRNK